MNEKVVRKYYILLSSYSNFFMGDYFEDNTEYLTLKECFKAYLEDFKVNRDLNKSSIREPICFYRIRECLETETTIYISDYRIIKHRNGRYSLKRSDID